MQPDMAERLAEALEPFAAEARTWADGVSDRYRPGITEPRSKTAHTKAEFSIGDLRQAAKILAAYRASKEGK